MKKCTKCNISKQIADFGKGIGTKRHSWCKACMNARNRERYKSDPERRAMYKKHNQEYRERNKRFVVNYLTANPCCKCGETNILTLQFDHLTDKKFNISAKIHDCSLENLQAEISKCQVLCANCHSIKSAHQLNNWKLKWLARSDSN